jgi:hypothetical protein
MDREIWGAFDQQNAQVKRLEEKELDSRDLLDQAGVQTVLQGGDVFPVTRTESMPGTSPLAVLLRY